VRPARGLVVRCGQRRGSVGPCFAVAVGALCAVSVFTGSWASPGSAEAARGTSAQYATAPSLTTTTATSYAFAAVGDATIDKTHASTSYGSQVSLVVDNKPVDNVLLKFNVTASGCQSITSATLRLSNDADGSVHGGDIYTAGSGWTESSVTWANAPVSGTLVTPLGAVSAGGSYTVDVTKGVTPATGEVDFRVASTSSDGAHYYSREGAGTNTGLVPLLTLTCAASSTDTSAPTAPSDVKAAAVSSSEVDLSWLASSDNVGVTSYTISRALSGTGWFGPVGSTAGGTSFQDKAVSPSTGYDYQITASDAAGNISLASTTATATTPATSTSQTYTFPSAADATIDYTNSTTNYGADAKLVVDNSPVDDSLLMFNVATTGCTSLTSASLRLVDNADGSVKGGDFYSTDPSAAWSESTVNWTNAPARGTKLATLGAVTAGLAYTVPVTAGLTTLNGPVTFRVGSDNSDGAHYYSKEGAGTNTALTPELSVTCAGTAPTSSPSPTSTTSPPSSSVTKLLTVVEENHSLAQMQTGMPYLYSLAQRFSYADHYTAITHPSLPNYLAIAGGSTFGVADDNPPSSHPLTGPSVFGQAAAAGATSRTYAESMPANCSLTSSGTYAVKHNPQTYFTDERTACQATNVPDTNFLADAAANALPNVSMLIPNLCDDAHDCSLITADSWLQARLPTVLTSSDFTSGRLAVVITADEDDRNSGNVVLTVVLQAGLDGAHKVVSTPLTHYSLSQLNSQVARSAGLLSAAQAPDMAAAFGLTVG